MRIMLVTRVWPTQRAGGMPHVVFDRAVALAEAGHDVHVVTTSNSKTAGYTADPGLWEGETPNLIVHFTDSPAQQWSDRFATQCHVECSKLQPQIVHSDSFDRNNFWLSDVNRTKTKTAVTMHGFGWGAWLTKWNMKTDSSLSFPWADMRCESNKLRQVDTVIGVSRWEWRMLRDHYRLPNAKLVYNPIAQYFFENWTDTKGVYYLCVGVSGESERGFVACVEACKRAEVKLRIEQSTKREYMPGVYDGAIALLLPTYYAQGYDLSVAEARARGVPAVLGATGSYLDEAEQWDMLVEPGSVEGVYNAITSKRAIWSVGSIISSTDKHRPEQHVENWLNAIGA